MARKAKGGISKHPTKGYRLTLGKKPNGKPRLFWLGHEHVIADHHDTLLRAVFEGMKLEHRNVWTDEDKKKVQHWLDRFKRSMAESRQQVAIAIRNLPILDGEDLERAQEEIDNYEHTFGNPAELKPTEKISNHQPVAGSVPTLHAMIDRHVLWYAAKGDRSQSSKARLHDVAAAMKKAHTNIEICRIDRVWLDSAIQRWKNRPLSKKSKQPISMQTVKTTLQYFRQIFNWMADNEEVTSFAEPRKMAKLFAYRVKRQEIEQLSLDDIKKLYTAGSNRQRLYLLLGVMCGMTQAELAATKSDEFDFKKVYGTTSGTRPTSLVHTALPGARRLVESQDKITPINSENLAFMTLDKRALLTFTENRKTSDAVHQSWDDLLNKVELDNGKRPSFKMCRKFLGQWILDHVGHEVAQIALQHVSQLVLRQHYATKLKNFNPLHDAQKELYAAMQTPRQAPLQGSLL